MRTTVNLPTDLHKAVASIAAHSRKSMNQTVADLIRRALAQAATQLLATFGATFNFWGQVSILLG